MNLIHAICSADQLLKSICDVTINITWCLALSRTIFAPRHCCTKVIMSGVNGNVIMSGCGDDNPDDEGREAGRDNTKSVSRRADSGGGRGSDRSQRAAVLPNQSTGNQGRSERSDAWESGSTV